MSRAADRGELFVRTLVRSARADRPPVGAKGRAMARLSAVAPAAPLDGRRMGSVVLAAALAAALGWGTGWTPAPATTAVRFAGPCAAGGEAPIERCGECATRALPSSDASSGSSSGGPSSSSG